MLWTCVLTLGPAVRLCDRVVGDVTRPPCDPSDRLNRGHEGDDGGRTLECAPIRAARPPRAAGGAGTAAGLPRRAACLLHPPRRCAVRPGRCAAERPRGPRVPAAAEPGTRPPARLGQHLRRAGVWPHRRRAAAGPARPPPVGRWAADLRGGRDHLAALRRRVLAPARPVLPPVQAFGGPADRRRLGLPVDLSAGLRAGLVDRPGGRPPAATDRGHRPHHGRAGPRAAWAAAHQQAATAVCVRRRLRLRPTVAGPGRRPGGGAGAAARRPLPATPTRHHACPAPPAGRAATAPSSPAPTRPPGRSRPPRTWPRTISTAP
jgi:hypothetical protein